MASCTVASSHVVGTRESAARPVSVRPARRVFAAIHLFGRSAFCSGGSLLFGRSASCRNPGAATCQGARCAGVQTSGWEGGQTDRDPLEKTLCVRQYVSGSHTDPNDQITPAGTCSMLVLRDFFFSDGSTSTVRPVLEAKAGIVCLAAATALAMLRLVPCD